MMPMAGARVYLAVGNTDMRKSINTLSILVEQAMALNPFSGDLFVFCNRGRTILKILYWQGNGFCLWQKRSGPGRPRRSSASGDRSWNGCYPGWTLPRRTNSSNTRLRRDILLLKRRNIYTKKE